MAIIPPLGQSSSLAKDIGAQVNMGQWLAAGVLALPFMVPLAIVTPAPYLQHSSPHSFLRFGSTAFYCAIWAASPAIALALASMSGKF
jgi:hypothetical protein